MTTFAETVRNCIIKSREDETRLQYITVEIIEENLGILADDPDAARTFSREFIRKCSWWISALAEVMDKRYSHDRRTLSNIFLALDEWEEDEERTETLINKFYEHEG